MPDAAAGGADSGRAAGGAQVQTACCVARARVRPIDLGREFLGICSRCFSAARLPRGCSDDVAARARHPRRCCLDLGLSATFW